MLLEDDHVGNSCMACRNIHSLLNSRLTASTCTKHTTFNYFSYCDTMRIISHISYWLQTYRWTDVKKKKNVVCDVIPEKQLDVTHNVMLVNCLLDCNYRLQKVAENLIKINPMVHKIGLFCMALKITNPKASFT